MIQSVTFLTHPIVGRAITIWEAIQKRSQEPKQQKNKQKLKQRGDEQKAIAVLENPKKYFA